MQAKKARIAAEAKAAKDAESRAKKDAQETWKKNQDKKKGPRPGEDELVPESGEPDAEQLARRDLRDAAMGKGDESLFEKKMTKEEKKAAAAAKRAEKAAGKEKKSSKKGGAAAEEEAPVNALEAAKSAAAGQVVGVRDIADEVRAPPPLLPRSPQGGV